MKWKPRFTKILAVLAALLFVSVSTVSYSVIYGEWTVSDAWTIGSEWTIGGILSNGATVGVTAFYFPNGSSLGLQNDVGKYVVLTVNSGALNTTDPTITLRSDRGSFLFTANETAEIEVSFPEIIDVKASGDNGTEYRAIANNTVLTINPLNVVLIEWFVPVTPWLPLMFIFGMIGLTSMFAGPMFAIYKIRHGEYYDGFRTGILFTVLGVALTIAWLWLP